MQGRENREDETGPAGEEGNGGFSNSGNRKRAVPPIAPHALDSLCDALFNGSSEDAVATTSFPAGETPGAAVPSVILEPAFTWCCPKCHGINFELPIVAELTEEQREEIQEEYGENPIGKWTVAPDTVECKHCQCEFDAIDFELIDEDEDEDEDGYGDGDMEEFAGDFIDDGSELGEFGDDDDDDDDEESFDSFLADVDRQFDDGEDGESWKRAGRVDDEERGHGQEREQGRDGRRKDRRQRNSKQIDERVIDEANRELSAAADSDSRNDDESPEKLDDEIKAEYADDIGPDHIADDGSPVGQREEEVGGERGDSGNGSIAEQIVNRLETYAKQLREEDEIGDIKPGDSSPAGQPRSGKSENVSLPKFETEWIIANPFGIGWIPGGM